MRTLLTSSRDILTLIVMALFLAVYCGWFWHIGEAIRTARIVG